MELRRFTNTSITADVDPQCPARFHAGEAEPVHPRSGRVRQRRIDRVHTGGRDLAGGLLARHVAAAKIAWRSSLTRVGSTPCTTLATKIIVRPGRRSPPKRVPSSCRRRSWAKSTTGCASSWEWPRRCGCSKESRTTRSSWKRSRPRTPLAAWNFWRKYRDLALGLVDAAVIATAERLEIYRILTLDERDFRAVRTARGHPLVLLPADRAKR